MDSLSYTFEYNFGGGMAGFLWFTEKISRILDGIACTALTFIMLLTVTDVISRRFFDSPIIGTYEIVGMAGAIVIGFSLPLSSWIRSLIYVDFIVKKFPKMGQNIINIITRIIVIVVFITIGYNMIQYATELMISREVSLTRRIPFYPIAYGLGISSFVQCLVHIVDIIKIIGGKYE